MEKLSKAKTGLALGLFMAIVHAVWAILVALGVAQGLIDWVTGMHMMVNPYVVSGFSLGAAVGLIVMVFVAGYILGWVFAALWNSLRKSSQ
jgi:hypothetical protein